VVPVRRRAGSTFRASGDRQGGGVRRFLRIRVGSWSRSPRPVGAGTLASENSNVWKRPRCANSLRYLPASPMLVVRDTQAATSSGVPTLSRREPERGEVAHRTRGRSVPRARWLGGAPRRTAPDRTNCTADRHPTAAMAATIHRRYLNYCARWTRAMEMLYSSIDGGRLAGLPGPAFMEWDFAAC